MDADENSNPPLSPKEALGMRKLELEVGKLESEGVGIAGISKFSWPIVTAILTALASSVTAMVLVLNHRTEQTQADLKREEVFFSTLHDATDAGKRPELRVAACWALSEFWNAPYDTVTANALGNLLVAEDAVASSTATIRENASEVIGTGISGLRSQMGHMSRSDQDRAERLVAILYGDAERQSGGVTARIQGDLWRRSKSTDKPDSLERKFWATEEAIRKNWKWLRHAYFHGFNLSQIRLYHADLAWDDLRAATVTGARFCKSNLYGADLRDLQDFGCIDVRGANIKYAKASPEFMKFAKEHGAVRLNIGEWFRQFGDPNDQGQGGINCYEHDERWPSNCERPAPPF